MFNISLQHLHLSISENIFRIFCGSGSTDWREHYITSFFTVLIIIYIAEEKNEILWITIKKYDGKCESKINFNVVCAPTVGDCINIIYKCCLFIFNSHRADTVVREENPRDKIVKSSRLVKIFYKIRGAKKQTTKKKNSKKKLKTNDVVRLLSHKNINT